MNFLYIFGPIIWFILKYYRTNWNFETPSGEHTYKMGHTEENKFKASFLDTADTIYDCA